MKHVNEQNTTVVGVFLTKAYATVALQKLKAAGITAQMIDNANNQPFKAIDLEDSAIRLYEARIIEGNAIIIASAGRKVTQALDIMQEAGAENINLKSAEPIERANALATSDDEDQSSAGSEMQIAATTPIRNGPGAQDATTYQEMEASQRRYGSYQGTIGRARTAAELAGEDTEAQQPG